MTLQRIGFPHRSIDDALDSLLAIVDEPKNSHRAGLETEAFAQSLRRGKAEFFYPEGFPKVFEVHPFRPRDGDEDMTAARIITEEQIFGRYAGAMSSGGVCFSDRIDRRVLVRCKRDLVGAKKCFERCAGMRRCIGHDRFDDD